ncbi:aspartate:alanine exchanger family transporter [Carboxydochorda subterranea]|uniref:Aspartate:alanine exchanger family transporter n=1 Tax=Carboxydichorda subterranea TaxID=3109565 RepID=A0ABZ1BZT7_9FIRM|nr:aspartate:alanine exchanger family transporter [Limnochorda sp. L945t]WRP17617.1 aspartate:alanine exchanger family transporter [Limnochorda sp. L945t]
MAGLVPAIAGVLAASPLLLLFAVTGIGYVVGRVRVGGFTLGVAAILLVGLAFGAIDPRLALPGFVYEFGLVLFVYTVGLASGPGFFRSLRRRGLRDTALAVGVLALAAGIAWGLGRLFGLPGPVIAGVFAGSLTNTPALAAVVETLQAQGHQAATAPVVGYSLAYPAGVLVMIACMGACARAWRVDFRREAREFARATGEGGDRVTNCDVEVTRPEVTGVTVAELMRRPERWGRPPSVRVILSRLKRGGQQMVVTGATVLQLGDVVTLVGPEEELEQVAPLFGVPSRERPELDRSQIDFRRIFVSNRAVAGKPIRELDLRARFGAVITRIKRGDVDLVPSASTVLELGDRVRVVAPRERLAALATFFGDSYRELSEIDLPSVSLGIGLGLLLGLIPVPLPAGATLRLGFAGGPLVAALVLGTLGRTGPIVWIQPHNANLTLRQMGLALFLAGIGTRSGYALLSTLEQAGPGVLVTAVAVAAGAALGTLVVAYRLLRIPMPVVTGMLAGLQTQPALLAFATEQAGSEIPHVGYATVYPTAMILKMLLAQLLVSR